jgi:nucleotide-binding universal stress UspA family protein
MYGKTSQEGGRFSSLTVAIDGSAESDKAIELAKELALLAGSKVHVIHVVEHVAAAGRAGAFDIEDRVEVSQVLDRDAKKLTDAGVPFNVTVVHAPIGHAAREIVAAAERDGSDAIVMGSRGLSSMAAAVIGSTAYKVLHLSSKPVIIGR